MNKPNKKLYIGILIIGFLVFVILNTNQTTPSQLKSEPPPLNQGGVRGGNSVAQRTGSITVSAGKIKFNLSVPANTLFYDALIQAKNAGTMEFSGKIYPGLGFFVTDIGTLHSGNGKNLLYYINGKEATVGVSSYALKDGDIIEWKLK